MTEAEENAQAISDALEAEKIAMHTDVMQYVEAVRANGAVLSKTDDDGGIWVNIGALWKLQQDIGIALTTLSAAGQEDRADTLFSVLQSFVMVTDAALEFVGTSREELSSASQERA